MQKSRFALVTRQELFTRQLGAAFSTPPRLQHSFAAQGYRAWLLALVPLFLLLMYRLH